MCVCVLYHEYVFNKNNNNNHVVDGGVTGEQGVPSPPLPSSPLP